MHYAQRSTLLIQDMNIVIICLFMHVGDEDITEKWAFLKPLYICVILWPYLSYFSLFDF